MTEERYDPDLLTSIPPEILAAAKAVADYFAERNVAKWALAGCQSRDDDARRNLLLARCALRFVADRHAQAGMGMIASNGDPALAAVIGVLLKTGDAETWEYRSSIGPDRSVDFVGIRMKPEPDELRTLTSRKDKA